jgi:hypothetical protein
MMRDDKMPIMEHEAPMTSVEVGVKTRGASTTYGRSTAWKLAVVTLVIFLCAFVFLMLFLVTPIFFSLNHPRTHEHSHPAVTGNMTDEIKQHSHPADEDRRRRDAADMREQMMKLCGCDVTSVEDGTQLRACMQKCRRSGMNIGRSMARNMRKQLADQLGKD